MAISLEHNPSSPSCNSCGSKEKLMDLCVGRNPNSGQTTVLCLECRYRLFRILKKAAEFKE